MTIILPLLLLLVPRRSVAQEPAAPSAPSPQVVVHRLLDSALDLASATPPPVHAFALLHIADNYGKFSPERSRELFNRAFSIAGGIEDPRARAILQGAIVKAVAPLDPVVAARMAPLLSADPRDAASRNPAIESVVSQLVAKKNLAQANELLASLPSGAEYPFGAAHIVLKSTAATDPEHLLVFTRALAAFQEYPHGTFPSLLSAYWKDLPDPTLQTSLRALQVCASATPKQDPNATVYFGSDNNGPPLEAVTRERLEALSVLRTIAPAQAADLIAGTPAVRALAEQHPDAPTLRALPSPEPPAAEKSAVGKDKPSADDGDDDFFNPGIALEDPKDLQSAMEQMRRNSESEKRAAEVLKIAADDPAKALGSVSSIPQVAHRVDVLASLARKAAAKDPAAATALLAKAVGLLAELKEPLIRMFALIQIAQVYRALHDDPHTWDTYQQALQAAVAVHQNDTSQERPNTALPEYWPSTQGTRMIVMAATEALKEKAEPLLADIADPSLALFARIAMAQALLGRPMTEMNMSVSH